MKLKKYLEKEGLNQSNFAKLVGVSRFHINRLVNLKILPSCKLLKKIDEITKGNVSLKDFSIEEKYK